MQSGHNQNFMNNNLFTYIVLAESSKFSSLLQLHRHLDFRRRVPAYNSQPESIVLASIYREVLNTGQNLKINAEYQVVSPGKVSPVGNGYYSA